ncbi:MAG: hypothetical protein LBU08_02500, partial [Tannerellaceae bacterium]|nr:hypothetical protein [Tannerellaceae bacterium]
PTPVITLQILGSSKSLQVEDTLYLKALTFADGTPVDDAPYTWITPPADTLEILPYPDRTDTLAAIPLCGLPALSDSISIIAISSSGARDTFRLHILLPPPSPPSPPVQLIPLLPPLPENDPHETAIYEIYTLDGRRIYQGPAPASLPLLLAPRKGTPRLYILRTSRGTFKLLLPL